MSINNKSVTVSGLTLQVPNDFLVKERKANPRYTGSADSTYIGAPNVDAIGLTVSRSPGPYTPSMEALLENAAATLDGCSRDFSEAPATEFALAGFEFQRVNFTVEEPEDEEVEDRGGEGFVMLGADGEDQVFMWCAPNANELYQVYEKIALSLRR